MTFTLQKLLHLRYAAVSWRHDSGYGGHLIMMSIEEKFLFVFEKAFGSYVGHRTVREPSMRR